MTALLLAIFLLLGWQTNDAATPLAATLFAADPADAPGAFNPHFTLCAESWSSNCVVDGDTFWLGGEKIRIADIDTPETHPARCAAEQQRGDAATMRLQEWLNAAPFTLAAIERDRDVYGRKLRLVMRDGGSVGTTLVDEGLARWYAGGRRPWC